jgi:hypothetical protein
MNMHDHGFAIGSYNKIKFQFIFISSREKNSDGV